VAAGHRLRFDFQAFPGDFTREELAELRNKRRLVQSEGGIEKQKVKTMGTERGAGNRGRPRWAVFGEKREKYAKRLSGREKFPRVSATEIWRWNHATRPGDIGLSAVIIRGREEEEGWTGGEKR